MIDKSSVAVLLDDYQNGSDDAGNKLLELFKKTKYCDSQGEPRIGRYLAKVNGPSTIIDKSEIWSAYWYGWSLGLRRNKNIGDPFGFCHSYGKWFIRSEYTRRLRQIKFQCEICGYTANLANSDKSSYDKGICANCGLKDTIKIVRYTKSLDIPYSNYEPEVTYNIIKTVSDSEILSMALANLKPNTRAHELLSMFINHEIEVDSDWKEQVAKKWETSVFRVVIVWRKVKTAILEVK